MNPHNMQLPIAPSISEVPELTNSYGLKNPLVHALWHHGVIPCGVPDTKANNGIENQDDLNSLVTVSGTPNYLPPMRFHDGNDTATWQMAAALAYLRSTQNLIADIYMHWLKHKSDKDLNPINLMWDKDIPLPTEATALWWLMQCESWPLPTSDIARLLRMAPAIGDNLTHWFPPQPFVFPQCIHLNNITNRPRALIDAVGLSPMGVNENMTPDFLASLNRSDREAFARTSSDVTPIFRPSNGDNMLCHERVGRSYEEISAIRSRYSEGKFTSTPDGAVDTGYAREQIQASIHHLDFLQRLRGHIMAFSLTIPGLPSHRNSIYDGAGMHLMCYQRANLTLASQYPLHWTQNESRIVINDASSSATVPRIAPKFWFGFVGDHRDWNNPDVNQNRMHWVQAYLAVRPHALKQLFKPNTVDWDAIQLEAMKKRYSILHKAGRIVDPMESTIKDAISGFNPTVATAFKSLKKD